MREITTAALVLGASGMIGLQVVQQLLDNPTYHKVYAVSRKKIALEHPKLEQLLADFDSIDALIENLQVDHLYSCLGSTQKKTPDKADYYQIDHDYPVKVASILKDNGCQVIALVSSMGADEHSKNFYLRMKGETERDLIKVGIPSTLLFRPSLLIGERNENRLAEDIFSFLFKGINLLLWGPLKNYKSIQGKDVASAMIHASLKNPQGVHIYKTSTIKELV
ncbi:NAD-dependent epimerase/dehydratase family protein [Sphingobacterium hungaricum]